MIKEWESRTMRDHIFSVGLAILTVGIATLVTGGCGTLGRAPSGNNPVANGKWIYDTGNDPNGQPISYSDGMMMRTSCAGCHGADGHGLRTPMFVAPNITYHNLTDPAGMLEPDGGHGPTYTDALIRRAVTEGIAAEGDPLNSLMPRWQLSNQEWNDLLAYLKTLQ
jgi:cytochrome c oxidase subunit 2